MKIINMIHLIAGLFITFSTILTIFVNINWIYLALFTGLNLIQYSFTNWCPLEIVLKKIIKDN